MTDRPWLAAYPQGVPADVDLSKYPSLVALMDEAFTKYADRIAYRCHDYDDAENMGLISAKELPDRVRRVLGTTHSSMITAPGLMLDYIARGNIR